MGPGQLTQVFASATDSAAVTPNDSTDVVCNALFIGGAGNIAIKHTAGGAAITYAVPAGFILPVAMNPGRVMATGTTATGIIAMRWGPA